MANNYRNPWVLDTASANPLKGGGYTGLIGVTFMGYASASDKCIMKDGAGRTILELWGAADLSPVAWARPFPGPPVLGLTMTTLGSGTAVVDVE